MSEFLDFSTARRPNREKQKIELDLPFWIIRKLEAEAQKEKRFFDEVTLQAVGEQ